MTANPSFVALVAALVLIHWAVPRPWRPWAHTLGGVALFALVSPGAGLVLVALTAATILGVKRSNLFSVLVALIVVGFGVYKVLLGISGPNSARTVAGLVGIAFAVPRVLHVLIDCHSGRLTRPDPTDVVHYLWYWPLVIIGPIHRIEEHQRQTRRARWDPQLVGSGLERILIGLFTVTVIANGILAQVFSSRVDRLGRTRPALGAAAESVEYGLTLYASFAGWSSVAIGLAAVMGHRVVENFRYPFLQPDIASFWRGWHITLTRFATEYVYRPAAAQFRRHTVAVTATMLAIAFWHEVSGRYVVWGAYHAAGLALHSRYRQWRDAGGGFTLSHGLGRVPATMLTFIFVMAGFTFTRSATLADALRAFRTMGSPVWG